MDSNSLRALRDQALMAVSGCKSAQELEQMKREIIDEAKRLNPEFFELDEKVKRAMMAMRGASSVEEAIEELAIDAYLQRASMPPAARAAAKEALEGAHLSPQDRGLIEKLIDEELSDEKRA